MKKSILLFLMFCTFNAFSVLSQTTDQLVRVKNKYYLNDKKLNNKELKTILKSEQESAAVYKKAMTNNTIGTVFAGVGTVFIIYAIANPPDENSGSMPGTISDEEMNKSLTPLYIGAATILIGMPFIIAGGKQVKKSITIYNSKHTATGYRNELKLDIGLTLNRLSLSYRF